LTTTNAGAQIRYTTNRTLPTSTSTLYTGPIARALGGADIAMLIGLPVSAGIYLLTCRSLDLENEWRRVRAADIGLEPQAPASAPLV